MQPLHLYVHWPWCQQKCPYCDFNSHATNTTEGITQDKRRVYLQRLKDEVAWWLPQLVPHRPIASVFFGGGTPSLMWPREIEETLNTLRLLGSWQETTEVTLECNPASVIEAQDTNFFQTIKACGVNRVSIGVQGLEQDWLSFLGRKHSVDEALQTLDHALNAGLRTNADVIYGLPNQSLSGWNKQLQKLSAMGLHHISAYQLTIEPNTAFWGQIRRGEWQPVDSDTEADFFESTRLILLQNGYENYEISNFAKPGEACRHNLGVWRGEDYLGVGAGAHGSIHLNNGEHIRYAARKHPEHYKAAIPKIHQAKHLAQWFAPQPIQAAQDRLFASLRLQEGVDMARLYKTYGNEVLEAALNKDALDLFVKQGWLSWKNEGHTERLALTNTGWPLLSGLLRDILPSYTPKT